MAHVLRASDGKTDNLDGAGDAAETVVQTSTDQLHCEPRRLKQAACGQSESHAASNSETLGSISPVTS